MVVVALNTEAVVTALVFVVVRVLVVAVVVLDRVDDDDDDVVVVDPVVAVREAPGWDAVVVELLEPHAARTAVAAVASASAGADRGILIRSLSLSPSSVGSRSQSRRPADIVRIDGSESDDP